MAMCPSCSMQTTKLTIGPNDRGSATVSQTRAISLWKDSFIANHKVPHIRRHVKPGDASTACPSSSLVERLSHSNALIDFRRGPASPLKKTRGSQHPDLAPMVPRAQRRDSPLSQVTLPSPVHTACSPPASRPT